MSHETSGKSEESADDDEYDEEESDGVKRPNGRHQAHRDESEAAPAVPAYVQWLKRDAFDFGFDLEFRNEISSYANNITQITLRRVPRAVR